MLFDAAPTMRTGSVGEEGGLVPPVDFPELPALSVRSVDHRPATLSGITGRT